MVEWRVRNIFYNTALSKYLFGTNSNLVNLILLEYKFIHMDEGLILLFQNGMDLFCGMNVCIADGDGLHGIRGCWKWSQLSTTSPYQFTAAIYQYAYKQEKAK